MAAPKGKGLTIGILLGKEKKPPMSDEMSEESDMPSGEEDEGQEEELPLGLVEAAGELREALKGDDDEAVARALHSAIRCCEEM